MGNFKSGYVALIGSPNVGKSTLLNQVLKQKISITTPKPQTTRNRILGILTREDCQLIFVDTPGIHRPRDSFNRILVETALSTLKDVDVICFMIEVPDAFRENDQYTLDNLKGIDKPTILVINKIDRVKKAELLPVMDRYSTVREFKAIVPVSALHGDGVVELLNEIVEYLPEGPKYFPDDHITDQPERFLVAELIREKVFRLTRREVPYATAVTVEKFEEVPERNRIDIEATIHVERESQKGIVIGKGGRMLKEIGRQARLDIEHLLGTHVFLSLFVRVQKKWRKDPRILAELGYRSKS